MAGKSIKSSLACERKGIDSQIDQTHENDDTFISIIYFWKKKKGVDNNQWDTLNYYVTQVYSCCCFIAVYPDPGAPGAPGAPGTPAI
jgi:hypothetical protein